ncbi:Glycosyltransferase involved in cell wall bisynthesis [Dyadobacter sp. SG02]|uniref:glycosyltransferase family 2 protein n=1 Tax=Dyadobacter sp. SG02 TaxID=1855291 RepID=UPI0008BBDF5E|nr:glycosyltransferase family 2 protein [Dyadobacter sp. SG02]SEJ75796.1 Glycosyltransferase involved in cell wall bisynthesis [Dyadobacter sp. SG02]
MNKVSVLMPTYNQAAFINRAINSLKAQTFGQWELIIINDGSTDHTEQIVEWHLSDPRVIYVRNDHNIGLGASLNRGLEMASNELVAYLPSDDVYFSNHLAILRETIMVNDAYLACSGIVHSYNESLNTSSGRYSTGRVENASLQLVQVMHRKTSRRWLERTELVTSDLDLMFWDDLQEEGKFVETGLVTAEWVNHPKQRHKIISELHGGGLKTYKEHYRVSAPVIFVGAGNYVNELSLPSSLLKVEAKQQRHPLKILLVGELSFNPERILAFEQHGHKLYGLWIQASGFLCNVGPFFFGDIHNLNSVDQIEQIQPDVIYSLLNYGAVALAHSIMRQFPRIPFVWHFKESPFFCRQTGQWDKLVDLYRCSDGQIYLNDTAKSWFDQITGNVDKPFLLLDGDLPKIDWFGDSKSALLSATDGAFHTVVPGRPYGLHPDHVAMLAQQNIHLHFYGNFQQNLWARWISEANRLAPGYLHMHDNCEPDEWTEEFSKYDAGWLHIFDCNNYGELARTTWNELNYPARIPTLAAAGIPMLLKDNSGHLCATQKLVADFEIGILFKDFYEIGERLGDDRSMGIIRDNLWNQRHFFAFDTHIERLIAFFREVIDQKLSS